MKLRVLWMLLIAFALVCTMSIPLAAQDHDRDDANRHVDRDRDHDRDHDRDDRWENRNGWEYRTYQGNEHPEGWNRGDRTEWRNCDDGRSGRQYDCYSYQYQGRPYYYYQDENGRTYVRRHHQDRDHDGDHDRDDRH